MAKDPSKLSDQELAAEIAALEQATSIGSKVKSGAQSLLSGAESGATNLLSFIPEVASIPVQLGQYYTGNKPVSPTVEARQFFQIPEEPKTGIEQGLYRFAEGFTPAAAMAAPSFAAGPVVGGVATLGAGLLGGFGNMAAKGLFPENSYGQMLVGLAPAGVSSLAARVRRNVPSTAAPSVSEETGIPMTGGQRAGSEALLRQEAAVAKTEGGAPIFQRFGLSQASSAEDFANKIQQFGANPNLTATQINEGVIDAVNYQNTRLVNKFRAQNRVNFNAAEKAAGNQKIFDTKNLNSTLDDQIAYYSSEQMPAELRAVADKLRDLKSSMTKQEQQSLILNAEGQPAVVIPEQAQKLTIGELQKNLESWGKAAKTGEFSMPGGTDNVFKGVAPGTVKGIARRVLNGFRADLDEAATANIKGANELSKAREGFREGLKELDAYAETPFVKYFMKDNPSALDATESLTALQKATPTERVVMLRVLGNSRPDIVASIRNKTMQNVIESSNGDSNVLLSSLKDIVKQKSEQGSIGLNDFLFSTPAEKAKVNVLIRDLESINKKPVGPAESLKGQIQGTVTEGAAVAGGWTVGKAVATIQDAMNMVSGSSNSAEKLAWMMTNPQGQTMLRYLAEQKTTNKPLPQTYVDTLNTISKYTAVGTIPNRSASDMSQQEDLSKFSDEQLQQMIKDLENK